MVGPTRQELSTLITGFTSEMLENYQLTPQISWPSQIKPLEKTTSQMGRGPRLSKHDFGRRKRHVREAIWTRVTKGLMIVSKDTYELLHVCDDVIQAVHRTDEVPC